MSKSMLNGVKRSKSVSFHPLFSLSSTEYEIESDSETMNLLTVPKQYSPRNKNTGFRNKHIQKKEKREKYEGIVNVGHALSRSCEDLQGPLLELPNLMDQNEGELGSLLCLWSESWPLPSDPGDTSGLFEAYAPGSPQLDVRFPQKSQITMEYEDTCVSSQGYSTILILVCIY